MKGLEIKEHAEQMEYAIANACVRDAWTRFIGQLEPFDWYLTLTFRDEVHPEQANRRYNRFIRQINESLFGRRWREKGQGIYHVCAIEYQRRGVLHFHTLMGGGVWKLRRLTYMDLWDKDNGYARIESYNPNLGAKGYLSKYVSRGGEVDKFLPPWRYAQLVSSNGQAGFSCTG
jgi:hypothetical protein